MNKLKKALISILLIGIMVVMTACNATFDAAGYVKSCLDLLTRCEYEEYVEFTKRSKDEAILDYEKSMDYMMSDFEALNLSEELVEKYRDFFMDLYKMTKYEVAEAVENEDGTYLVDVKISKLTGVFNGVTEELNAAALTYGEELAASGQEADEQAVNEWVYEKLYEIVSANMESASYEEPITVTVGVITDNEVYTITEADYAVLEESLVDLGDMAY